MKKDIDLAESNFEDSIDDLKDSLSNETKDRTAQFVHVRTRIVVYTYYIYIWPRPFWNRRNYLPKLDFLEILMDKNIEYAAILCEK